MDKRIKEILDDEKLSTALKRAVKSYRENREKVLRKYPRTLELAKEVRKIKERSIENLPELVKIASENMTENGISVHFAKDASEGRKIVHKILSDCNMVVKAKSMTTEELNLREFLEKKGIEVWETDLGEFIIQVLNEKPMHILTPAIHLPREEIARVLSRVIGTKLDSNVCEIVSAVRRYLREKFFKADAGISGANVISAETGSIIIIENEGNVRLVTGLPEKHVVVVGIEKLVPTLGDAFKVAEVTWRFAGYGMPSYVNVISSPSKTGDIEKTVVRGAHGPKEVHVVFLDNGRMKARDSFLREALLCLRCGSCMYECPVYWKLSGHWGGGVYTGGIGIAWTAITDGNVEKMASMCLLCGRCAEICPLGIDCSKMMRELRKHSL